MQSARMTSGGFSARDGLAQSLIEATHNHVLTEDRYLILDTGIESRFESQTGEVHKLLYSSLGPTTDLLRYFPDFLYFDRLTLDPTWEPSKRPQVLKEAVDESHPGKLAFFVEYKYSDTERYKKIDDHPDVPTEFIGQIEREAWLTYRRLTGQNPKKGIYLDDLRPRVAMFYAASFAPDLLYGCWEDEIDPIYIHDGIARPGERTAYTAGSGTPWINFDIGDLKPLEQFLAEDLYWDVDTAAQAVHTCKETLFP